MTVVTRFAPSPTGFLHIGGARTALFNWLYARHHGGKFLLRIEDTDRKRSTQEAVDAIYEGLEWLGLNWDGDATSQFERADRHREAVQALLDAGKAYRCYCTPEELTQMRETAKAEGLPWKYSGIWRDRDPSEAPEGVDPVIRIKAPLDGEVVINDLVQGEVRVANETLDDMVLLRGDGSPTYMLAVVVDDHDMGVTHVIRGDDHLTNAFRQYQLYVALGWDVPEFAHIPLIHGPDGAKMSKRHGALGVDAYRDEGYLPEAMRNYLLRLGWAHGDEEIISTKQAIEWFDLSNVGRAASRFDFAKLSNLNGHYVRSGDDQMLVDAIAPLLEETRGSALDEAEKALLCTAMPGLKERAKNIVELSDSASFYVAKRPLNYTEKARNQLDEDAAAHLRVLASDFDQMADWEAEKLEQHVRDYVDATDPAVKLGKVAQPLRAALSGTTVSPPIFDVMVILGKQETLARINDAILATNF
ncbi:MAG: glutamate--tRNA ligase [Rhodospirillales bacterium]|jgi:glutamyl-tRNA synthetase|nr:glutamate--tRNA ligase [Rhodospirillales bacterium]MBT4040820.1 glutamate--tRNA ligase [Rhodospirillales bacterium]MBT4625089.1 glutamate--tRNA ligase [Rhodospirillales bacterium]MBT5352976.1 glutamate--tRNA ligase [Rhodospirillales bacterium]MBT5519731.1 glutamate--tRNA ligase [Rhodospirillales bacterium]